MIILDTHALIWWAAAPGSLSRGARRAIEGADQLGVCVISFWEVSTLVRRGRLELDRPVSDWVEAALGLPKLVELALSAAIAVRAGSFGDEFHGDAADRLIAATALVADAALVTKDDRLREHAMLRTIW